MRPRRIADNDVEARFDPRPRQPITQSRIEGASREQHPIFKRLEPQTVEGVDASRRVGVQLEQCEIKAEGRHEASAAGLMSTPRI